MSETTLQAISYKTIFETFYMYVWTENIDYFLCIIKNSVRWK